MEAVNALKVRSCLIDGEAVICDKNGLAVFERLRQERQGQHVFLFAFDLLELDGKDLRREPLEVRKATLRSAPRGCLPGVRLNEHLANWRKWLRVGEATRSNLKSNVCGGQQFAERD